MTSKSVLRKIFSEINTLREKCSKSEIKKNDYYSIFVKTPKTKIISKNDLKHRESPSDAEERSFQKAVSTLKGEGKKREPLLVWKVKKKRGGYFYSVRDGNTTFQMLLKQGWDKFPVEIEKEIDEDELVPVKPHKRNSI